jgi:hypothetical protein
MRTTLNIFLVVLLTTTIVTAQNAPTTVPVASKTKMEIFKSWAGVWKGEGSMQMGPGVQKKSSVEERIELKLDGAIVVVEGIGKTDAGTPEEKVVHHAFAVLSYDQVSQTYKFKSYLKDGKSADAWFEPLGENKYQWGFDAPSGKIRYTITLDPVAKTWNEIGEFSQDGTTWRPFFEMKLTKQS